MIDVACFCGTAYSFDGDVGVCPKCGEVVSLVGAFPATERRMLEELEQLAPDQADRKGAGPAPAIDEASELAA